MKKYLSSKQLKAITLLVNGCNARDLQERLNIRWSTLVRWRQQPEFMEKLQAYKRYLAEDDDYCKEMWLRELAYKAVSGIEGELFADGARLNLIEAGLKVFKTAENVLKECETMRNDQKQSKTIKNNGKEILSVSRQNACRSHTMPCKDVETPGQPYDI